MKRVRWVLLAFGVLLAAGSVAVAADGFGVRPATYGPWDQVRLEEVHHHGHHGYYGGWGPVVRPPRVYVVPAPAVVVPAPVYPAPVYPPAYPAPGYYYYYGYPQGYIPYRTGGVSLGVAL
ncbi:MAG: hypothetical protein ABSG86_22555 [Thermoguttaceae bacterium]|jgi:hypothetical protein